VRKRDARTQLRLDARPLELSLGTECSALEPLPASFVLGFELAFAAGQLGPSPRWIRVRDLDAARGRGYALECSGAVVAALCTSCEPSSCLSPCDAPGEPSLAPVFDSEVVLRVHAVTSASGSIAVSRTH
jgi:hypothetical protein